ncbi:replication/maintenance protein RepL [Peptostreptococcus equinus]|uniref:Replication/maintenance protein RepL n=1 Tax=Peptostreptococcus equinus TaxID=3003601 RepID=A0ABY7JT83_9FIRM|nr:replication/maintenance protein RepL [Peptostreptococcus sp. CBA3647]WAW15689.1 replication/maintenance protein RepL [Peptostreptococcus sp. CBA3647]
MFVFNDINEKYDDISSTESRNIVRDKTNNKFLNVSPKNFLKSMENISSKKSMIPLQLVNIMDKDNKINHTLDELSEILSYPKTGLSVLFGEYKKYDFMIKIRNGVYMINPLVFYKGSKYERDKLLASYNKGRRKEGTVNGSKI